MMVLLECTKHTDVVTNCVFYDNETGSSIGFLCTKKLDFDLVVNQTYKVVVSRSGSKVMILDILEPVNSEISNIDLNSSSYEQKISLMEYNEKQYRNQEIANKIENSTRTVISVANIIRAVIAILVGAFCIKIGLFNSADTITAIFFSGFGGIIILIALSSLFSKK